VLKLIRQAHLPRGRGPGTRRRCPCSGICSRHNMNFAVSLPQLLTAAITQDCKLLYGGGASGEIVKHKSRSERISRGFTPDLGCDKRGLVTRQHTVQRMTITTTQNTNVVTNDNNKKYQNRKAMRTRQPVHERSISRRPLWRCTRRAAVSGRYQNRRRG
jgi:hypothetical protein